MDKDVACRWARIVALGTLTAVASACGPPPPRAPLPHTGPFAAGRDSIHMTTAQRVAFTTYVASTLTFDTIPGVSDRQKLTDSTTGLNTGPDVTIAPRVGVHRLDSATIDSGAVMARIVSLDSTAYPKLGLRGAGVYYWVAYRDSSFIVPADTTRAVMFVGTVGRTAHAEHHWKNDWANWKWVPGDEMAWTPCQKSGCCYINPF